MKLKSNQPTLDEVLKLINYLHKLSDSEIVEIKYSMSRVGTSIRVSYTIINNVSETELRRLNNTIQITKIEHHKEYIVMSKSTKNVPKIISYADINNTKIPHNSHINSLYSILNADITRIELYYIISSIFKGAPNDTLELQRRLTLLNNSIFDLRHATYVDDGGVFNLDIQKDMVNQHYNVSVENNLTKDTSYYEIGFKYILCIDDI